MILPGSHSAIFATDTGNVLVCSETRPCYQQKEDYKHPVPHCTQIVYLVLPKQLEQH